LLLYKHGKLTPEFIFDCEEKRMNDIMFFYAYMDMEKEKYYKEQEQKRKRKIKSG
jgi:hypothetical protein